ncbi:MAG: TPM domain-containing protein [Deltaproteobacteria bacterium]|nr:TPM domain-containing protein [Deltaproteobacteria bacterium]
MGTRLSESDRDKIARAVAEAESHTSGEIVPVIVDASDDYPHADLVAGLVGLFSAIAAAAIVNVETGWTAAVALVTAGFLAGLVIARLFPALRVRLVGRGVIQTEVHQRALQAFVENGVSRTRDRTGILIFVSLLERRVEVLADEGIHAKVPDGTWDEVVALVLAGVRAGSLADGLTRAIARCGELLAKDFPRREDDTNELPDAPRSR